MNSTQKYEFANGWTFEFVGSLIQDMYDIFYFWMMFIFTKEWKTREQTYILVNVLKH